MAKKKVSLTRLEGEIMQAVWDADGPVAVRDVVEAVNAGRPRPLAYNTIQTMLTILRDKGVVTVVKSSGRAHLFRPKVTREAASQHMVTDLVDRLFQGRVQPLLQQMIDQADLTPDELHELRAWVDAKLQDAEEDPS